jgi:hypothetical protein
MVPEPGWSPLEPAAPQAKPSPRKILKARDATWRGHDRTDLGLVGYVPHLHPTHGEVAAMRGVSTTQRAAVSSRSIVDRVPVNFSVALNRLRELLRGRDVAVVYAIVVVVISIVVAFQPPALLRDIVQTSSTNLVNLRRRPLAVLFVSPLVISPVAGLWIVAPMIVGYGELQRWLGRASALVVGVLGHVGATLFVATMEIMQLAKGRIGFSIATSPDVGVSYGLAAVAGILVVRVSKTWRRPFIIASLIVILGQFLILRNFTGLGHLTAWLIGLAVAIPVSRVMRTARKAETLTTIGLADPHHAEV